MGGIPLPCNHHKMWEGWDYNSSGAQICYCDVSKPTKTWYVAIGPPPKNNKNIYNIRRYLTPLASQPRCKKSVSLCLKSSLYFPDSNNSPDIYTKSGSFE